MRQIVVCELLLLLGLSQALGQSGPTIVGPAYTVKSPGFAPGQVVTFQVTGLKTVLAGPAHANIVPLPHVLSGISVKVNQYAIAGSVSYDAPLSSIVQTNVCSDPLAVTPDCMVTDITLQLPFELAFMPFNIEDPNVVSLTELVVIENGVSSKGFKIGMNGEGIHILTGCDPHGAVCVTHADGSLVTDASPAVAGEEVVIYAVGLGPTTPGVATGAATPVPAPTVALPVYAQFNFSPNAGPAQLIALPSQWTLSASYLPDFAGLTPGQVGLYQINVRIPATIPLVQACNASGAVLFVSSNLTITISGVYGSYDAAPICVKPPA
jgi:uncharacterized protein (TIGR03437 family)